ncbi:MAG: hypothetical protein ACUVQ5_03825 [Candidatus Methanomethylicaceae archaeon]
MNNFQTRGMMKRLNQYFEVKVEVPRIKHCNRQTLETLINEEALLFAKYLRGEKRKYGLPELPS